MKKFPKINRNVILSIFLLLGVAFSVVTIVFATAPDPGHNFTEASGGMVLGGLLYGSGADTLLQLSGNITTAKQFLSQTGTGAVSAAPIWSILAASDIPDISATYSAKAGNTSLVTVGTIGTGTWNADAIADGKIASALTGKTYNALTLTAAGTGFTIAGGTVSKTLTVTGDATISGTPITDPMTTIGDIIIRNGSNITARLAGAAGFLKGGVSTAPAWSTINLAASADVGTSILPTANGGTGIAFFTAAGPTAARIFTFPDANATVLTDNTDVTVAQGGTGLSTLTAHGVVIGEGASNVAITSAGTAGQILRSGGASADPAWSTPTFPNTATNRKVLVGNATNWVESTETWAVPGATVGNILESDGTNWVSAVGGVLIGKQVKVTGNTTYTPTAGTLSIVIRGVAGGGGGGGATGSGSTASWAGGGASGGYFEKRFTGISSATTYTIAVGAGGTAGAAANGTGGTGGVTTFACVAACTGGAVTVTANGGLGGVSIAAGTSVLTSMGGAAGAVSTNGDANSAGSPGEYAVRFSASTGNTGSGAPSVFGSGGKGSNAAGAGVTPVGYGGGGSGAASITTAANAGGVGAPGVLIIDEYR